MTPATEQDNERLVIAALTLIAVVAIIAAATLSAVATISHTQADTTVIVAFLGIATGAVTGLAVRRTRITAPDPVPQPPAPDWAGPLT
mgnify:CR=1 FL=1